MIRVELDQRTLDFTSRTSEPDGRWFRTTGQAWNMVPLGQTGQAQWSCPGYRVTREVTVRDDHIHIADTFTNTGEQLVGVMYENALVLREKPLEVRLAGRPAMGSVPITRRGMDARWPSTPSPMP